MSTSAVLLPKPGGGGAWQKIDGKWQSAASKIGNPQQPKLTERNLDIQVRAYRTLFQFIIITQSFLTQFSDCHTIRKW